MGGDEAVALPAGWVNVRLEDLVLSPKTDLVDGPFGSNLKSSEYVDSGVPVLKIQNIKANRFVRKRLSYVTPEKAAQLTRHSFVAGDLMITKLGEPLGLCCEVPDDLPHGVFVADLMRLRPSPKIVDSSFLLHAINSVLVQNQFKEITKGTTRQRVNLTIVRDIKISLPPLAEQHRIVAKIEELFSELDQGVASLKTAREQLKVYRQSLLKNAFEGKLTAATGWREKPLGQLLGFLTSGSRGWAAYYATSGDLFVRAQNIKHDRLELEDVAFVALPDKAEGLRTRIQQGDLLITITGANVTKSALVKHDLGVAYVSQHVALCRPTTEILPEYLYWFVVAEAAGRRQLTDMAYGAGKPGLNLENIRSVNVPFPGLHEQQEIVEQIESKLSEADQLDQTLATALQQADALRQSILKKAFCGQLVKQDKNEEPASALLERIRAERLSGPGKKKTRSTAGATR